MPKYNIDTDSLPPSPELNTPATFPLAPLRIQLTFVIVLEKECLEYDHVNQHHNYLNAINAIS